MTLLVALGLAIALEGALYAIAPSAMKRAIEQILSLPDHLIRQAGIAALAFGVVLVWLGQSLFN